MPQEPEISDYSGRIRSLRAKLGLTQVRLAELLGVSFASVNRWENAQATPSKLAWEQILRAEALGLDAFASREATALGVSGLRPSSGEPAEETTIDFSAAPNIVKVVAEGERLSYGHLFNPAFATEISMIDPLPHQRIAVYERILTQPRIRLLLADDAGAGKTIMGGLTIRELTARRLVRRVLIVVPAGLIGNWEKELRTLFSLRFKIVTGPDARSGNPFIGTDNNFVIISMDTLAGERMFSRLQEPMVTPYDLVIFDEAHKLSANREPDFTIRKTDRYRLAEALAGIQGADARWMLEWSCQHMLLLTATPHMGRDFPYYCLWRLLEPEVLSTVDAFHAYPPDARSRHFIRRTKEEMVKLDGTPIYPTRFSDTLSYDLTQGEISEQTLYDQTTAYLQTFYNRARILNRQAAAMAMSVFQRRLASSTYSLMRSFERRIAKLDALIDDIRSGRITPDQLQARQRQLGNTVHDIFDEATADEEEAEEGREGNEVAEEKILGGVVAVNLAELEVEQRQVQGLLDLARKVYDGGDESKFDKLREVLRDPRFKDEKILIFTEHRDTMEFLVRRLEGMGFGGQVAQIHGGMDYLERQVQVEFFRRKTSEGGATYMVCTDAAAEGINLQFCWLMVNFDIPWNPARLEQRMGRIHRYGQKRDKVFVSNLIAGKTREGRVLKTLLDKLERIRKELGSDKVFDVVGRLFEGVSLKQYMEQAITDDETATQIASKIEGTLTKEQVAALEERERRLYGEGGDVRPELPRLRRDMEQELYRRLLPGYVRRFIEKAAPLLGLEIDGDLDGFFCFRAKQTGSALDALWPVLESYGEYQRQRLTVYKPADKDEAIFLHPGEPLFERIRACITERFTREALKGAVFVDPDTTQPYMLHMATVSVIRKADTNLPAFANQETLEYRLVGFKQHPTGEVESCPVEHLLLLKNGSGVPVGTMHFAATGRDSRQQVKEYAIERVVSTMADRRRREVAETLAQREEFVGRGFDYQDAELAANRARLTEKARSGDPKAKGDVTKIRDRQRQLLSRREEALTTLRSEPELIAPGEVTFIAHALVVPSTDPDDRLLHDAEVEALAMRVARTYEETAGAEVKDVSKPTLARAVGLDDWPGFDLLSVRSRNEERAIEVKGCAGVGHVEVTENEWARACNLRNRYWLYVVFNCASTHPRLMRVQDPFGKLIVSARGGVIIDEKAIFDAAEQ